MTPMERLARLEEIERRKTSYGAAERIAARAGIAVGDLIAEAEQWMNLSTETGRPLIELVAEDAHLTVEELEKEVEAILAARDTTSAA